MVLRLHAADIASAHLPSSRSQEQGVTCTNERPDASRPRYCREKESITPGSSGFGIANFL